LGKDVDTTQVLTCESLKGRISGILAVSVYYTGGDRPGHLPGPFSVEFRG
jgi:hypothetical protein